MKDLYKHWEIDYIKNKYHDIRNWSDRFKSEVYFLEKIVKPGIRILDIGCAHGDLYYALKKKFGDIDYTGIDVSEPLIRRGRQLFPEPNLILGNILDDDNLVAKESFDLVLSTGVFQHEPRYAELLEKMLLCAKDGGSVLFDIKLFHNHRTLNDINECFGDHVDHKVFYIILNFDDFINYLSRIKNIDALVELYGYYSGVNNTVRLPDSVNEEVCSAHVLIRKSKHGLTEKELGLKLNLPKEYITKTSKII